MRKNVYFIYINKNLKESNTNSGGWERQVMTFLISSNKNYRTKYGTGILS